MTLFPPQKSLDERLHDQFLADQIARSKTREAEADRRKDSFAWWAGEHRTRLGLLPLLVRSEVESMAWGEILAGRQPKPMGEAIPLAEARVTSRLRVRRYGRLADDPEEQARQWQEMRAEIGGASRPQLRAAAPPPAVSPAPDPEAPAIPAWFDEMTPPDDTAQASA